MDRRLVKGPARWADMRAGFAWPAIERFNIGTAISDDWAEVDPERPAILQPRGSDREKVFSYGDLSRMSNKLANVLSADGVREGDRVAVLLGQCPETVLTHIAAYKTGAIMVPLFTLFGEDGLNYRLRDSGAKVVVTDSENLQKILNIRAELPALEQVFCIDGEADAIQGVRDFWAALTSGRTVYEAAPTKPDTPALLVYTSGTTGPPKGALHGHRVLLGHLPGFETHHEFAPQTGDVAWTPADWAWMGGLADILLPSLYLGIPVVAYRAAKFEAGDVYDLIRRFKIRNIFFPPTALKLLHGEAVPQDLNIRTIASGGEPLGAELLEWARAAFGVTINEFYGSTECNLVLGNCASCFDPKPGSTGQATPGKEVAILDDAGGQVPTGKMGEIAVRRGDPAMFLEYWNKPEKTAKRFAGEWMRMGDEGYMDADGYVFFAARTDDVITSAGYRIGPAEIEECLLGDPAVKLAAVVGIPDAQKGEVVKAFVTLKGGAYFDEAALIERVQTRLSPHLAPRSIEVVPEIPLTATGKIMRRQLKERI
jgi:acetyl-CoA synthetase